MTVTVSRLFDDYATASKAVADLEGAGVPADDISIVASNADNWYDKNRTTDRTVKGPRKIDRDADGVDDRAEGAGAGAGIGATVGGVAGLLAGLGLLAIPGVGPVVAAGWLAATAAGAAAGGATGGIIGALTQSGIGEDDAHVYAEGLRRGGTVVSVRAADNQRARIDAILDRAAVNIRDRGLSYRKAGWSRFDPQAAPYDADQVRAEREQYRTRGAA